MIAGVAPDVELGVYRVFGCEGESPSDAIIRAMRRAHEDGMDIINLSLGIDAGFSDSSEAAVVNELSKEGVLFTIAVGNSGEDGIWLSANPSSAIYGSAISSFDNSHGIRRTLSLEGSERAFTFGMLSHSLFLRLIW